MMIIFMNWLTLMTKSGKCFPIASGSVIEEIRNENYLRFVSYKEPSSNINVFPYIAKCIRVDNEDPLGKEKGILQ